eukprot:scaffold1311_cov256-Pinguiococcus_pyrenoidosus.AAC.19
MGRHSRRPDKIGRLQGRFTLAANGSARPHGSCAGLTNADIEAITAWYCAASAELQLKIGTRLARNLEKRNGHHS